tara:strand:- start:24056 stop:24379 length:324 start_codon:yes stop_codon:yes gene_type:complete
MGVSAGIGGGSVLGVVNGTAGKVVNSQQFGVQDWAAVVAIVSGLCLAIKTIVDTYYTIQDRKDKKKKAKEAALIAIAEEYYEDEKRKEANDKAMAVQKKIDELSGES